MKPVLVLTCLALAAGMAAAAGSEKPPLLPAAVLALAPLAVAGGPLPGTSPLETPGDLAEGMVAGIDRFLDRETMAAAARRAEKWKRDFSSPEAYSRSVQPNRERLRKIIGAVDPRVPFEDLQPTTLEPLGSMAHGKDFRIEFVRWPVLPGVEGDGLLLIPDDEVKANVVALPDCDWTPEQLAGLAPGIPEEAQFARRLAENGCRVLIPALVSRADTYSGNPQIRMTNQPHREWIYRGAFEMGRHVIGYEVQKVLAAVDWFEKDDWKRTDEKIAVWGYGEGGLLALYSAALDPRIDLCAVSGYFGPREAVWREPIYRNVWSLLDEFGDAEIASLIAPRALIVEHCRFPEVSGPPAPRDGRSGAAPGAIVTPPAEAVEQEFRRALALVEPFRGSRQFRFALAQSQSGQPGDPKTLSAFLTTLLGKKNPRKPGPQPRDRRDGFDPQARMKRQVEQLSEYNQRLMREGEFRRREFWAKADASSPEKWRESTRPYRDYFWDEVIGRFPPAGLPANPRSRLIYDEPAYRGYEVMLDVWPDVYAYGILLLPKDLKEGERRPVVVCQHGLEGRPQDVADAKVDNPAYHRYAARLAERGFITFSPQNPYIFGDRFRLLQRKLNPLKKSLFSVIVRQHERILEWLAAQPYVDRDRIGFYGLSYGGKTAVRVPALLENYALSICSADYNEWIWKNVSTRHRYSYMFTGEWEMVEFDLGNTFNYAEMSWLICPRPFMVERGHDDGVAPSEWVAYEFSRTRERYDRLGLGNRTEIEFFNGPHTIHGVGTFDFLHRHLAYPHRKGAKSAEERKGG